MKRQIVFCALLAMVFLLLPRSTHARDYSANIGRFMTMDTFEGDQETPQSLHKYTYAHDNPVNLSDPNGHAVYFVERRMGLTGGGGLWYANSGHGYLLFTPTSDPGSSDPFAAGYTGIDSFSWHPNVWDYDARQVPGRIWQQHPDDLNPKMAGIPYKTFLVTASAKDQATLLSTIASWNASMKPGYEIGKNVIGTITPDSQNEIGAGLHMPAPAGGVYYSFTEQNCVWWATVQLKSSGIAVPQSVYDHILIYNGSIMAQLVRQHRLSLAQEALRRLIELPDPNPTYI